MHVVTPCYTMVISPTISISALCNPSWCSPDIKSVQPLLWSDTSYAVYTLLAQLPTRCVSEVGMYTLLISTYDIHWCMSYRAMVVYVAWRDVASSLVQYVHVYTPIPKVNNLGTLHVVDTIRHSQQGSSIHQGTYCVPRDISMLHFYLLPWSFDG